MCGICGFFGPGADGGRDALEKMTDALARRGPDDRGVLHRPGVAGLGHRRLSIIDLSPAGRQPMPNEAGDVLAVVNGEIYNFVELRAQLEARGHAFRGRCDAEVVPHAYEEWGDDFPRRLRGMFAIGLWDAGRGRLLLARDRLGKKPLYYHRPGDGIIFASELKALAAHPAFPRTVSRRALGLYLTFGYVPSPLAIFESTFKVPPAHTLVLDRSGPRLARYWDPMEHARMPPLAGTEEELTERMEEALLEAVRLRLVGDVPLGAFLSGGIDSSLVVACMRRMASGPVRTFTIGFWEREFDEAAWARRVAAHLGAEHTELYVEPRDALGVIPELPEIYDEPFGDASAIPTCLVSRLARQSVTVALTGDGGDELLGGYPRYRWFEAARRLDRLPPAARRRLAPIVGLLPHPKAPKAASWLGFGEAWELYLGMVGIWDRGDLARVLGGDEPLDGLDFRRVWEAAGDRSNLEKVMLTDLATYLPDDILVKVDRASMHHALEARVPLLDHVFVELALRLPQGLKYRRGRGKLLLRRLLERRLPRELFERPKKGFSIPLAAWLRGELKPLLMEYTSPARLAREGIFNPGPVGAMVEEHLDGRRDRQYPLWALLMFQMWRERWIGKWGQA